MKFIAIALMTASVALAMGQQGPRYTAPGPRPADACDMKKIELAPYCEKCGGLLDEKQQTDHKAKEYSGHKIKQVKACAKKYFHAECHQENCSFDKGECCGKPKEDRTSWSALYWICEGCGSRESTEGKKCAIDDCPKKKMRQECSSQPTFPHCNEKWWREEQKKKKK